LNSYLEEYLRERRDVKEYWEDEPSEFEWDSSYSDVHFTGRLVETRED
jgi:hypothetical protein